MMTVDMCYVGYNLSLGLTIILFVYLLIQQTFLHIVPDSDQQVLTPCLKKLVVTIPRIVEIVWQLLAPTGEQHKGGSEVPVTDITHSGQIICGFNVFFSTGMLIVLEKYKST